MNQNKEDINIQDLVLNLIQVNGIFFESEIKKILNLNGLSDYFIVKFLENLSPEFETIKSYNRNIIVFDNDKIKRIKKSVLDLAKINFPDNIMNIYKIYGIVAQEENTSINMVKALCSNLFLNELKLIECIDSFRGYVYIIPLPGNQFPDFLAMMNAIQEFVYSREIVAQEDIIQEFQISKRYSRILIERLSFKGLIGFKIQRDFDNIKTNKVYSPKIFILPKSEILDSRRIRDKNMIMESIENILQETNLEYLYSTCYGVVKKSLELDLTYGIKRSKEIIPSVIIIASILHNEPITFEMLIELIENNEDFDIELGTEARCNELIRKIKQQLHIPTKIHFISYIIQVLKFMNIQKKEREILIEICIKLLDKKHLRDTITGNNPWAVAAALIYITANNCMKLKELEFLGDYRQITIAYASKVTEVSLRNVKNTLSKIHSKLILDIIMEFYNKNM